MWLFGAAGTRNPVGPVATVFPEFIARDEMEPVDGGRQGDKRRIGAARRRSRGHGPARLDGPRPRATVADKVMKSGETAGQGNGPSTRRPHGKRSAQARSWKPGRRRQPNGVRGRSKPEGGETPQAARCASTRARPAISQGAGDARIPAAQSPTITAGPGIGTMTLAMDLRELTDDELMAQAREWRQRALRGEKDARGFAHELECEVRRRFPRNDVSQTLPQVRLLGVLPQTAHRRWKPW